MLPVRPLPYLLVSTGDLVSDENPAREHVVLCYTLAVPAVWRTGSSVLASRCSSESAYSSLNSAAWDVMQHSSGQCLAQDVYLLCSGAKRGVLVLEASAAADAMSASSASADSASAAVAERPSARRLSTESLIDADSCSSHALLDLTEVPIPPLMLMYIGVLRNDLLAVLSFLVQMSGLPMISSKDCAANLSENGRHRFHRSRRPCSPRLLCICSWRNR